MTGKRQPPVIWWYGTMFSCDDRLVQLKNAKGLTQTRTPPHHPKWRMRCATSSKLLAREAPRHGRPGIGRNGCIQHLGPAARDSVRKDYSRTFDLFDLATGALNSIFFVWSCRFFGVEIPLYTRTSERQPSCKAYHLTSSWVSGCCYSQARERELMAWWAELLCNILPHRSDACLWLLNELGRSPTILKELVLSPEETVRYAAASVAAAALRQCILTAGGAGDGGRSGVGNDDVYLAAYTAATEEQDRRCGPGGCRQWGTGRRHSVGAENGTQM